MGATPVGIVSTAGFTRPAFSYCLDYRQSGIRAIYGQDTYLGEDCQDGQLEVFNAQGVYDVSGVAQGVYNAFSPLTAMGTGLDRVIKINGIRRKIPTYSTAPFRCLGQAGASADGVLITDPAGYVWALPAGTSIPDAGEITVTATCQTKGAIPLAAGAIDTANGLGSVGDPPRGFQSVVNVGAASVGQPVETDSTVRQRQVISTALPSQRLQDGLKGALAAISGVTRCEVYVNNKSARDINGLPGHCIACVVDGGDSATVAAVIDLKKGPGPSTFGDTVVTVPHTDGKPDDIAFFYLRPVPIGFAVVVENLGGYTPSAEGLWTAALAAFVNGLDIGEDVANDQAFAAAKNYDGQGSKTFKIVSFAQARDGAAAVAADTPIAFYEAATCDPANIAVTVLPQVN